MSIHKKLTTKDIALLVCFTALYVVLSFLPMFQMIGLSRSITVATIIVPLMGIILGRYLGTISAFFGGLLAVFVNPFFGYPSLIAGPVTAFCAGSLFIGKKVASAFVYLALILVFGFYPSVGPVWLFPWLMWFHIVGFAILLSPLQSYASNSFRSDDTRKLLIAFFVTILVSTLAGQIAGSLLFEAVVFDATTLKASWIALTFLYPAERTIIAIVVAVIGVPLLRVLRSANLVQKT